MSIVEWIELKVANTSMSSVVKSVQVVHSVGIVRHRVYRCGHGFLTEKALHLTMNIKHVFPPVKADVSVYNGEEIYCEPSEPQLG